MSLAGKVYLITGASKGIGKATALRVASEGASVVINYNSDSAAADAVVAQIGADRALAVRADASSPEGIDKLVAATVEKFGKIDVVVPNAGWMPMGLLDSVTPASFDRIINMNVKGPLFLVQKAVPHMPTTGSSRIIFISTGLTAASGVAPAYLLYVMTKGAIDQLTRALSKELAKKNITVNAVAPGPTATELFYEGKPEAMVKAIEAQSPFNRLGTPEEIAEVIAFMSSDASRWIAGHVVRANGASFV